MYFIKLADFSGFGGPGDNELDPAAHQGVATVSRGTTFTPVASTRVIGDVRAGPGTFLVRLLSILLLTLSWTILLILIVGLGGTSTS